MTFRRSWNFDSASRLLSTKDLEEILDPSSDMGAAVATALDAYVPPSESGGTVTKVNGVSPILGEVTLTKGSIGLGNVADLAPADYPVSTAQAAAIAARLANVADLAPEDLPVSDATENALATKADLVSGVVPLSQVPKSQAAAASSIAQRTASGALVVADAASGGEAPNLAQVNASIAAATSDVRYKRITASSGLSSADATTWVNIPDLFIDDAETGQEWQVDLELAYTCALAAPGIQVRIRGGSPGPTAAGDWELYGRWGPSLTTTATANSNHQLLVPINYPTSTTLNASFGGAGAMSYVVGSFLFRVLGSGLTGRRIAFDFMQRQLDASNPVSLVRYASRATFARVA